MMKKYKSFSKDGFAITFAVPVAATAPQDFRDGLLIHLPCRIAEMSEPLFREKAAQLISVLSGLPVEPEEVNAPSLDDL